MINSDLDFAVIIPVQQGGNDLNRNALAPFGRNQVPLIVWKIRQLKEVVPLNSIYVSTHSDEIKKLVISEGVNVHHRSNDLNKESLGPFGDVIVDVVKDINHQHVAWVSAVVPFMGEYDYRNAFEVYSENVKNGTYDSLMSVNRIYDYLWGEDGAVNYHPDCQQPKRTELPATYRVTNGLFIRSRVDILSSRYYVGSNPCKYEVSKLAGLDINAHEDLDVASALSGVYQKQQSERSCVVFLDFDGVIFDSVVESYAMAMLTSQKISTLSDLNVESDHARRFFSQRYLVGPAWHYYYLLKAIESGDDECFSTYLPIEAGEEAKEFQAAFFATRQVIRNNFWDDWLLLTRLYPGAQVFIDLINANKNIAILTTKDYSSVKALLDRYGLHRPVDIYDVKTYEKFGSKSNFIDDYIRSSGIKKALFIDDSLVHLKKCEWVEGLEVVQAGWGYVSSEDRVDNKLEVIAKINDLVAV